MQNGNALVIGYIVYVLLPLILNWAKLQRYDSTENIISSFDDLITANYGSISFFFSIIL